MIPREILKKIRQSELRTNCLVAETLAGVNCGQPDANNRVWEAANWLNLTINHLPKLNYLNSAPCNRLAEAGAGLADDAATRADDAARNADDRATCADGTASFADARAGRADNLAGFADSAATFANDVATFADDRYRCADDAASLAGNRAVFAENAARVAERLHRNAAAGISSAQRAFNFRNHQIYFSTP